MMSMNECPRSPSSNGYSVACTAMAFSYCAGPPVFSAWDCLVRPGESVALLGPSGAGKTTLLLLLAGLLQPQAGHVTVDSRRWDVLTSTQKRLTRSRIGFIFQSDNLLGRLSVRTNVLLPLASALPLWRALACRFASTHVHQAEVLLAQLGLAGKADAVARELSGGQQQRVAIARALVHRPRLILADEPFTGLDVASSAIAQAVLSAYVRDSGATLVMSTHDTAIAHRMCTRFVPIHSAVTEPTLSGLQHVEADRAQE